MPAPTPVTISKRGFPIYKGNPFVHRVTVDVRKKHITLAKGDLDIVKHDSKDYIGPATIGAFIQVEKEEFIKVFTREMQAYFDLSKVGTRMMGIVFRASQHYSVNNAEIFLPHKIATELYKEITADINIQLSLSSYQRGIKELLKKEFIAEHPNGSGWFYTNPNIFFNGNRVRFVKEYCQTEEFNEVKKQLLQQPPKQLSLLQNTDEPDDIFTKMMRQNREKEKRQADEEAAAAAQADSL